MEGEELGEERGKREGQGGAALTRVGEDRGVDFSVGSGSTAHKVKASLLGHQREPFEVACLDTATVGYTEH